MVIELDSQLATATTIMETTKMRFILTASFTVCSWPVFSTDGGGGGLLAANFVLTETMPCNVWGPNGATVQIGQCAGKPPAA